MSLIIILTQNKLSTEFWQNKFSNNNVRIEKVQSVKKAIHAHPELIIVDSYFSQDEDLSWNIKQIQDLRNEGYVKPLISLSPTFINSKRNNNSKNTVYQHHFNQSFFDTISMIA